jgi:hypothetical protein
MCSCFDTNFYMIALQHVSSHVVNQTIKVYSTLLEHVEYECGCPRSARSGFVFCVEVNANAIHCLVGRNVDAKTGGVHKHQKTNLQRRNMKDSSTPQGKKEV